MARSVNDAGVILCGRSWRAGWVVDWERYDPGIRWLRSLKEDVTWERVSM
jgi:hypothetical protein